MFDVHVWGTTPYAGTKLSFAASAMGANPSITTNWIASSTATYRNLTNQTEYGFFAKIVVNGSTTITSYQLAVTVINGGFLAANEQVLFSGGFAGQLVGSITG